MIKKKRRRKKKEKNGTWFKVALAITVCYVVMRAYNTDGYTPQNGILDLTVGTLAMYLLIKVFLPYARKLIRKVAYLSSGITKVDKMDGKEFEKYLKAIFEREGYCVKLTKDSGDFGADLVMYKKGLARSHKKIIVQAKRYNKKVGVEAIQQIVTAKEYYKADRCAVATNSYFTKAARKLAEVNGVMLWDREFFINTARGMRKI